MSQIGRVARQRELSIGHVLPVAAVVEGRHETGTHDPAAREDGAHIHVARWQIRPVRDGRKVLVVEGPVDSSRERLAPDGQQACGRRVAPLDSLEDVCASRVRSNDLWGLVSFEESLDSLSSRDSGSRFGKVEVAVGRTVKGLETWYEGLKRRDLRWRPADSRR